MIEYKKYKLREDCKACFFDLIDEINGRGDSVENPFYLEPEKKCRECIENLPTEVDIDLF
jgi:hypothetical protein